MDLPAHVGVFGEHLKVCRQLVGQVFSLSVCLMWRDTREIRSDERAQFERHKIVNDAPRSQHAGLMAEMHCAVCP